MTISDDYDKTEKERIDIFYELVKDKRDKKYLQDVSHHRDLFIEAERLDIINKAPLVLAELLFTENIINDIPTYRNLLLRFTINNPKAQRYLIGGVEQTIELHSSTLINKTAVIFKTLYDYDVLDENVILDWAQKVSKRHVSKKIATEIHEKVVPFVQWLKDAEEEESSSEASDDLERSYMGIEKKYNAEPHKSSTKQEANEEEAIEEQINIDDI